MNGRLNECQFKVHANLDRSVPFTRWHRREKKTLHAATARKRLLHVKFNINYKINR